MQMLFNVYTVGPCIVRFCVVWFWIVRLIFMGQKYLHSVEYLHSVYLDTIKIHTIQVQFHTMQV